jgi:hypothetical protein
MDSNHYSVTLNENISFVMIFFVQSMYLFHVLSNISKTELGLYGDCLFFLNYCKIISKTWKLFSAELEMTKNLT